MFVFNKFCFQNLKLDTKLSDVNGKELPALEIFTAVIAYIKNTVYEQMKQNFSGFNEESDILWVLTVPAIWSDSAKQFMRKAAEKVCQQFQTFLVIILCVSCNYMEKNRLVQ